MVVRSCKLIGKLTRDLSQLIGKVTSDLLSVQPAVTVAQLSL